MNTMKSSPDVYQSSHPRLVEPDEWPVHEFRAMGSQMSVRLALPAAEVAPHFGRVVAHFAEAEARLSRFDEQSELSALNANAGSWQRVSPLLWDVLDVALAMAAATNGLFDPTLLAEIRATGYDRDFAQVASRPHFANAGDVAAAGRWQSVQRRVATHELYLPAGMGLDLGGIAKGVIAEQVVENLRAVGPCLVDAGGDLVAGEAAPGWPGWPVAIAAPASAQVDDEAETLATLWLCDRTLATSGVDYRRWQHNGAWAHHILDPRKGRPASTDLVSVSVMARQAAQAEAWAKVALILGAEAGLAALQSQRLGALLVEQTGSVVMTRELQRYFV